MNYQEAISYIHQTPKFSRELGNRLLLKLLSHCNHPQERLQCIHIAGTNGKGSTAIMLSEMLRHAGYRVGLFISPYIERFNERIQINGEPIPDEKLAEIITHLKELIEIHDAPVSEFALDTATAFCWFEEQKVDIVVLETGLGGRLDATNIISKNLVSVLCSIGLDHTQYLGTTYKAISKEKCGIIKERCPVVCYPLQHDDAMETIAETALQKNAPLYVADIPFKSERGIVLNENEYALGLEGDYQGFNAATAYKTIEVLRSQGYQISDDAVKKGLQSARNPARFEWFGDKIILDGAHNPAAIQSLCDSLAKMQKPIWFCTAMMEDKDYRSCISILKKYASGMVVTQLDMPRCCQAEILKQGLIHEGMEEVYAVPDPIDAIKTACSLAEDDAVICICGSLYLAGMVRPYLQTL